ncbi:MAG: hypothetical protein AVDCRST_MAG73-3807 [uncultured Thermomicrobiales bacterium]|uniref:Uncharacterized protein n=1 Tax=uncultured Thermomicrobiales bacterium TaxID=1645740 RepID=A0A6J4V0R1_9BACT|nr:MAG: hypothetical protein AVDCRST_MAG73-3807 [uncultured Thermomicrobiales bacterium]
MDFENAGPAEAGAVILAVLVLASAAVGMNVLIRRDGAPARGRHSLVVRPPPISVVLGMRPTRGPTSDSGSGRRPGEPGGRGGGGGMRAVWRVLAAVAAVVCGPLALALYQYVADQIAAAVAPSVSDRIAAKLGRPEAILVRAADLDVNNA